MAFNVYRSSDGGAAVKLNSTPLTTTTDWIDNAPPISETNEYFVRPVVDGIEQEANGSAVVEPFAPVQQYLEVPLQIPEGGTVPDYENAGEYLSYTYTANDASVGDVDGDGQYEIILKWDPTNAKDNSHSGYTGNVYLDAYELDGTLLWRIDLGMNIRAGAHYTQFMVYDLDGDGRAEVACKTAEGSRDGLGNYIANDPAKFVGTFPVDVDNNADHRTQYGYILTGYEFLTIFDGQTGAELATTYYNPARNDDITSSDVSAWGDNYGNRVDRFLAGIAYLDGVRPSLVMCRGYYTRSVLVAYDWRDGQLTERWVFDSDDPGNGGYAGQGNHQLSIADVDGDGLDEIVYGACVIDDDGTGLYTTGLGHGDALHVSDMDPTNPGLEIFDVHESSAGYLTAGGEFRDAMTGELLIGMPATDDVGRGVASGHRSQLARLRNVGHGDRPLHLRRRRHAALRFGQRVLQLRRLVGCGPEPRVARRHDHRRMEQSRTVEHCLVRREWNQQQQRAFLEQRHQGPRPPSRQTSSATGGKKSFGGPPTTRHSRSGRRRSPQRAACTR